MHASGDIAPIRATVKWFNMAKGFGFVTPVDGSPEAFLHLSALKQAGYESVGEGAGLLVEIGQSPKGRQVLRVLEVDNSSARPAMGPRPRPGPAPAPVSLEGADEVNGVVKWFSGLKGYGFVSPDNGGKDVFVHITVLRNAGLSTLQPGQMVRMRVINARKGPEAVQVEVTGAAPVMGPGNDLH
ncbi:MAG TPA: cold shock domain-containing protein [Alphaproteobacteria bacterium]|jgi:CspA family cold shock protein|nr:cold shock domain-containing protein [Alphaproteobacteria bacterium]